MVAMLLECVVDTLADEENTPLKVKPLLTDLVVLEPIVVVVPVELVLAYVKVVDFVGGIE